MIFLQTHPVDRSFYAIISYSGTSSPEIVSQDPPDWSSRDHDCQNNNEKCLVLNCAFLEYSEVIRPGVECLHIDKLQLLKSEEEKYLDESLVYSGEQVSFSLSFGYGAGINGYRYKTPDSPITLPNAVIDSCGERGSFEKCTRFEDIKIGQKVRFVLSSTLAPMGHAGHGGMAGMDHGDMNGADENVEETNNSISNFDAHDNHRSFHANTVHNHMHGHPIHFHGHKIRVLAMGFHPQNPITGLVEKTDNTLIREFTHQPEFHYQIEVAAKTPHNFFENFEINSNG